MAWLERQGCEFVPPKEDQMRELMAREYSLDELRVATIYQERGEFCPVKKGLITIPDWYPTYDQLVKVGVNIHDIIKRAEKRGYAIAAKEWFAKGYLSEIKRNADNMKYIEDKMTFQRTSMRA